MWARVAMTLVLAVSTAGAQRVAPGARAPEIDLPLLAGGRVKLSQLRGNPVVVSFWGTWCPPCREEFPELVSAYKRHHPDGLQVLAVNGRDQEFRTSDVERFVSEFAVPFPVALDQRGRSRDAFQILGLPTTFFIDANGVVQRIHRGPINRDDLESGVVLLLQPRSQR